MVTSSINLIKSVGKCLTTNIEQTIDEKKNPHIFAKDQLESIIDSNFEEKEPTSVEDALDDLMKTKGIFDDNNNESL